MSDVSDEKLIAQYLAGDEESLRVLFKQYLKPIYNFVCYYLNDSTEAEDVVQEVFIKVWKNLKKFKQNKKFKAWIFSIAKNACFDALRKKKEIVFSEFETESGNVLADSLVDEAPLPSEIFERQEISQILASAIEKLPLKYRTVLLLHYNDHFDIKEIAELLDKPSETIKSRHYRGIVLLRKILTESLN